MDALAWKDYVTVGLAAVGAVLGILNTWNAMSQRRVRLRVNPAFAFDYSMNPIGFSIDIVNLSSFSLTISEVGFQVGKQKKGSIA